MKTIKASLVLFSILATTGCATRSFIVTGSSSSSNLEAVTQAQAALARAEMHGCKARSLGTGAGIATGIVIGDSCIECVPVRKDQTKEIHAVNVLVECSQNITISPNGELR